MITGLPPTPLVTKTGVIINVGSPGGGTDLTTQQSATDVEIISSTGTMAVIPAASATLAGALDAARAAIIDGLPGSYNDLTDLPDRTAILSMIFDGAGNPIVAPITRYLYMPFAAAIIGYALLADVSGSTSVDVWKEPFTGYPPTVANSITGGNPMTLSSAQSIAFTTIPASWTTGINAADCLAFNVSTSSSIKVLTAQLIIQH
jgi:hypothetical protein